MLNLKAEDAAEDVRRSFQIKGPPVDVVRIAKDEGILLAPSSDYGDDFHGRIEFKPEQKKFILFYPTEPDGQLTPRQRFNVAHELGHYYLEDHREALLQGISHSSTPGFICRDDFEREADEFAAAPALPFAAHDETYATEIGVQRIEDLHRLGYLSVEHAGIVRVDRNTVTGEMHITVAIPDDRR
jgi:hypothetical protein